MRLKRGVCKVFSCDILGLQSNSNLATRQFGTLVANVLGSNIYMIALNKRPCTPSRANQKITNGEREAAVFSCSGEIYCSTAINERRCIYKLPSLWCGSEVSCPTVLKEPENRECAVHDGNVQRNGRPQLEVNGFFRLFTSRKARAVMELRSGQEVLQWRPFASC